MSERVYNTKTTGAIPFELPKSKRHWELDFLRGLCVVLMVIDHFCYSAGSILPIVWEFSNVEFWNGLQQLAIIYWDHYLRRMAWIVVISTFFIICGISCTLSHNNALRGVKTLAAGLIITVGTYLADSFFNLDVLIKFGVIHMLGSAILLFSLIDLMGWGIQKLVGKIFKGDKAAANAAWVRKFLPMVFGIIGLIIYFALPIGHFGKVNVNIKIDGEWVEFRSYTYLFTDVSADGSKRLLNFLSIFVELKNYTFGGADYFPILPYGLLVLVGSGIGHLVYETRANEFSDYIIIFPLGLVMVIASCIRWLAVFIINSIKRIAGNQVVVAHPQNFLIRINFDKRWNKPVSFVGRRALIVYLLHQVAIVAFFYAMGGLYSIGK